MKQAERDQILIDLQKGQAVMQDDLSMVKRGLYGDPINKTLGIIDRQNLDDEKFNVFMEQMRSANDQISKNSKFRKKVIGVTKISGGTGAAASITSIVVFFKEIKEIILSFFN